MSAGEFQYIQVVDSHTAGEPTRVVIDGGPDLRGETVAEQLRHFREEHDRFRSAVVNEPRGSDVVVGAMLTQPADSDCAAGVIFFNNVGYLGMCGHGTIGVVKTLAHLGRIAPGEHRLETPVGTITARLNEDGTVSVRNVASYRALAGVSLEVPGYGTVVGDVAWGGNWFFLTENSPTSLTLDEIEPLTEFALALRRALAESFVTATIHAEVDHVEVFGPPTRPGSHSRSFVLCPGGAYDRSPCGTGTSAKLACLYEDGKLHPDQVWRQESIIGSVFEGSVEVVDDTVIPIITGAAYVTAEARLLLDPADPYRWGIRSGST